MKKIFFLFCFFISLFLPSLAGATFVEDVFSDISKDYKYRDELQALYDRGMILPDASGKFSPNAYLNRDEFVGISMEVICERCIQPHTELKFLEKYRTADVYYDIDNTNPYFYCVAEADARNYVRGYDIGEACENGTKQFGERPFCPLNRINLEEAVAVLLRNSNIFTIEDNQKVVDLIRAGVITQKLGNDVNPRNSNGNPYTFYGYLQKALSYEIVEYTPSGREKIYKLLDLDPSGNVNPKKQITKEEFLKMSYIALKSNSCSEVSGDDIALAIDIWEKSCTQRQANCLVSKLDDPDDIYDFTPKVEGFCEEGIDNPSGYSWRFFNENTREEFFEYGDYLNDIKLPSIGNWKVYLTVRDRCGNIASVYSSISVYPKTELIGTNGLNVDIIANPILGYKALKVDFEGVVYGGKAPYIYSWSFGDAENGLGKTIEHLYTQVNTYEVKLTVIDSQNKVGTATTLIKVLEKDICLQDSDADGGNDCEDYCPLVPGVPENLWCPIHEVSCGTNCSCPSGYTCNNKDPLTCGKGVCIPTFDPKSSCLYNPDVGSIFGSAVCLTCPCPAVLDFLADLRKCDFVFPAITSPDAKNIYSQGKIWQVPNTVSP